MDTESESEKERKRERGENERRWRIESESERVNENMSEREEKREKNVERREEQGKWTNSIEIAVDNETRNQLEYFHPHLKYRTFSYICNSNWKLTGNGKNPLILINSIRME